MANEIQIFPRDGLDTARQLLHQARAVVCDIDGVLLTGTRPIAGAQQLLRTHRCVFVSNNSTHTAQQLAELFNRLGLPGDPQDFFLAGEESLAYVRSLGPELRVMVLASDGIAQKAAQTLQIFDHRELSPSNRPDIVLVCRDQSATFEKIEAAANAIRLGARAVVSNPDLTHPANEGLIHTETGALWQAIAAQIPDSASVTIIGKPETTLARLAIEHLSLDSHALVFLGDNLQTDAPVAARVNMPFIHTGGAGFMLKTLLDQPSDAGW